MNAVMSTRNVTDSRQTKLPVVAIIASILPSYRLHLHQRIAREMRDEIVMHSLFTHEVDFLHPYKPTPEINATSFGPGHACTRQLQLRYVPSELHKAGRIIRWLKDNQVSAVVLMGYADVGRVRILRWCHCHGIPCLLFGDSNIRGDRTTGLKAVIKRNLVRHIVGWSTALLVCGRYGREYWAKYGGDTSRMFDFPYEPDYDLIEKLSDEKIRDVRQRFNLRPERRRIVFSGRFVSAKRPELLVDAFSAIARERPEWDLVMVGGDDPLYPEPGRGPMHERVPADLKDRVIFTGFLKEQGAVSAIYRLSDVLCLPSDYEPWALVVNEAAAAGMAIVATDVVGAAAELVRDGVNGHVFPPRDLQALTAALLDVTAAGKTDALKNASSTVLADWRSRGDPIHGLRQASRFARVL